MKTRILSIVALLLMTAVGAWAQTETLLTTITPDRTNFATYTVADVAEVSGSYVEARQEYEIEGRPYCWEHDLSDNKGQLTVTGKEGYTITRVVFTVTQYPGSGTRTKECTEAPYAVYPYSLSTYPTQADQEAKTNSLGSFVLKIDVYGYVTPAITKYTVTLADGTEDADNWSATPNPAEEGQTVTIKYNGTKKVKSIKAVKKVATIPVTAITLNKTETEIKVGSTETLSVTAVTPEDATDKTYTWKTSDATKATVTADGVVTAVAEGTVTIYAEANDGSGVKGNCTVTVTSAVPEYYNKLTKINDNYDDQVYLLKQLGRGRQAYNSSLTAAQAYALATYQAAIDGKPVYVIMSSQDDGYEIHYAVSTDAAATEHVSDIYDLVDYYSSTILNMYYIAQ